MSRGLIVYRFGRLELDPASRRLYRGDTPIDLSAPGAGILTCLVEHAPDIVSREALIRAGWGDAAIGDNSLEKTISRLRNKLAREGGAEWIETVAGHGYRFIAPVECVHRAIADAELGPHFAPIMALVHGRAGIQSLDSEKVRHAYDELAEAVRRLPDSVALHIEFARACGLIYESSIVNLQPDIARLHEGIEHARIGVARMPMSAEAWITLSFVLRPKGDDAATAAAATRAMELEPENWHHALIAGYVCWGQPRLTAAGRVLEAQPGQPLARWQRATVFIARGTLERALAEVLLGCAAQDAQLPGCPFAANGLHLLNGQLLAERGQLDEAVNAFMRELAGVQSSTHVFARECAANTWYALGAVRRRQGQHDGWRTALSQALSFAPGHVAATAALRGQVVPGATPINAAFANAIILARAGRHGEAGQLFLEQLRREPPGEAGWILPVEPFLDPGAHPEAWAEALALVRVRAV